MPGKIKKKKKASRSKRLLDKNDYFLMRTTSRYVQRHLKAYSQLGLDEEFFGLYSYGFNESIGKIVDRALAHFDGDKREQYEAIIEDCLDSQSRFNDIMPYIFEMAPKPLDRQLRETLLEVLEERVAALANKGKSDLERNLEGIKKMFSLTDQELEFCLFLYICYANRKFEAFFVDELKCQRLNGRKYLANVLGLSKNQLDRVLSGTLRKIEFFQMDPDILDINNDFLFLFEDPMTSNLGEKFYQRLPKEAIPLGFHYGVQKELGHVLELLKKKTPTPTHILLYGSPGTGKSSFAAGLAKELKLQAYAIAKDDDNMSKNRRASIFACLSMTNGGDGSLIIIDEADNILNTEFSWFYRGETQDKGWLNHLLEEPGARMIWITNDIENIDDSVLRRFAFSLNFKPFNKRQRILLWENVLKTNKAQGFFSPDDIEAFGKKHKVSAAVIDMAVKKALEVRSSKGRIQEAVTMAIEAHQTLMNDGQKPLDKDQIEENYSLDGLNIKGDLQGAFRQLEKFDEFFRNPGNDRSINLNFLFHGAPGTGKSELARYIAQRFDREILTKRVSDLQNPYVGVSERNIRAAFQEAEREEAVLVIDEADSLLFSRDRAQRSYEVSFTNEFLTGMERYRGILICTTNRLKDLDQASIRRFQFKLGFDYLTPDGNLIFYEKLLKPMIKGPLNLDDQVRLRGIENLAPGDFKTVRDRFAFTDGLPHQTLIQALNNEAEIKKLFTNKTTIGF